MGGATGSDDEAVAWFRSFLRIRTVSGEGPSGSYLEAQNWLTTFIGENLKVDRVCVVSPKPNKPIVLATILGSEPSLPGVLLNSHYDVVPVMPEFWDVDPFDGHRTSDGKIIGRGAQDMKCVCVQYLVSLLRLRKQGWQPCRSLHLSFVPDEEVGGMEGMGLLLETPEWKSMLPIGLALDEGLASPSDAYTVFYGERLPWWLMVKAVGPTGHGSRFIENTAMGKLVEVCRKALSFRDEQETELGHTGGCAHANAKKLGDVTTVNLTMLRGGVSSDGGDTFALNVIPTEAEAGFDVRISPKMSPSEFRERINGWCETEGVTWRFAPWTSPLNEHHLTSIDRDKNPWWGIFVDAMDSMNKTVEPEVFPAGTDSRFLRELGIPALGFSPMRNSPILLHEHNEYLHEDVFLEGIQVYEKLLQALGDAPAFER